jgi:hypothetical protein
MATVLVFNTLLETGTHRFSGRGSLERLNARLFIGRYDVSPLLC